MNIFYEICKEICIISKLGFSFTPISIIKKKVTVNNNSNNNNPNYNTNNNNNIQKNSNIKIIYIII